MSKPRYDWWPYVKGMIRRYPALKEEYRELHSQSVTANYSGMSRGGNGVSRGTEQIALRELPSTKQREYEAVRRAIETTLCRSNGQYVLQVIDLVLWKKSHTLEGAALCIPCHYKTAQGWHNEFIRLVALCFGLMDE